MDDMTIIYKALEMGLELASRLACGWAKAQVSEAKAEELKDLLGKLIEYNHSLS